MASYEIKKETVVINGTTYEFKLLPARKSGKISNKIIGKIAPILGFLAMNNVGDANNKIEEFFEDDTTDALYELIFAQQAQLKANGQVIADPDTYFQGKYMEMTRLCLEAMRANCQDFFSSISGYLKESNFSEKFKEMREKGLIVPQEVENLTQNT